MIKRVFLIIVLMLFSFIPFNVLAETFDGEYSIDYLLRNYGVVTLGEKKLSSQDKIFNAYGADFYMYGIDMVNKGDFANFTDVKGAVLINGDYKAEYPSVFGSEARSVKSYIKGVKGNNVSTQSSLVTDPNYIDFKKLYSNVLKESHAIANNAEYHINSAKVEITKPGIYTINNMAPMYDDSNGNRYLLNPILIKNYDKNKKYIFNYYNEYYFDLPDIEIIEPGSNQAIRLREYVESGQYTGNIIFNFPNARFIFIGQDLSISLIAPKATVNFGDYNYYDFENNHYANITYTNIIASTIFVNNYYNYENTGPYNIIFSNNYKINEKIIEDKTNYYEEALDYDDDFYSRDYSIKDLLKNYNLVTLGHKRIDSKSKLLQFGNTPGSIKLFHITGHVLIAGDLYGKKYDNEDDDYYYYSSNGFATTRYQKVDRIAFDLESNEVTESYIRGNNFINTTGTTSVPSENIFNSFSVKMPISVIQPFDNVGYDNYKLYGKTSHLITKNSNYSYGYSGEGNISNYIDNYINFDRLYNNIIAEQKGIDEGTKVKSSNGVAHIKIGGNYVIDDISDINKIVFDNFDENKNVITVVTIKNSGDINFPEINRDTGAYKGIVTNDYFGKERATHLYEANTFISEDSYYGNIIFNVPNATYIKLKENSPFAGHLIAPNADVETPETHFAGCFIVNSIYGEGNTEAHFYPLTAYDNCECDDSKVPDNLKLRFNEMRLNKLLGGEESTIETNIVGDQVQYNKDTELLNGIINSCPRKSGSSITQILTNPKTYSTIGIVVVILLIASVGYKIIKSKRRQLN